MPSAVDIFSGSGGVTQGLRRARWKVLAACDNDDAVAATYIANHPKTRFVKGDITEDATIDELAAKVGRKKVDLLIICAPCQPFSSQNRSRGADHREQLIVRALAAVERLNPTTVFFENVPLLASAAYRPILDAVRSRLSELGYSLSEPLVRDAANYGVPQRRRRCIMFAARSKAAVDAFVANDRHTATKSVWQAIGDLPALEAGQSDPSDALHRARHHQPIAIERLRHIPADGGSRSSLPAHLELACHVGKKSSFSDVYGRMGWSGQAPTLTTGCDDLTRGRFAHPEQHRAISLREAARLQSFPDDYAFKGRGKQIATQIGNAVPPDMISAFDQAFRAALKAQAAYEA
ncbi:DNA cytosine methyltransferase [Devosia sp.]|uniref:DNA cytosine methyltransferase n=1 Tax=Devosia sp. TaxID=1871048 RepID=UPI001AC392D8|nr:DNA cytosine methyltransferase [Devosia sp.]MBN9335198.1 DNA cytosine methyltransferase [Devosia sp.]